MSQIILSKVIDFGIFIYRVLDLESGWCRFVENVKGLICNECLIRKLRDYMYLGCVTMIVSLVDHVNVVN